MKTKRFYIIPQRYPCFDGSRPLSFAIYHGRTLLAYSWSLAGAWIALQVIRRTYDRPVSQAALEAHRIAPQGARERTYATQSQTKGR